MVNSDSYTEKEEDMTKESMRAVKRLVVKLSVMVLFRTTCNSI